MPSEFILLCKTKVYVVDVGLTYQNLIHADRNVNVPLSSFLLFYVSEQVPCQSEVYISIRRQITETIKVKNPSSRKIATDIFFQAYRIQYHS